MNTSFLSANTKDLKMLLGERSFVALPREELERFHASIELKPEKHPRTQLSSTLIYAVVIAHYNYNWITFRYPEKNCKSVWHGDYVFSNENNNLFLDTTMINSGKRIFNECVPLNVGFDIRIAGVILDNANMFEIPHMGVVFLVKLKEQKLESIKQLGLGICGTGELQFSISEFDPWSKILISNLVAF